MKRYYICLLTLRVEKQWGTFPIPFNFALVHYPRLNNVQVGRVSGVPPRCSNHQPATFHHNNHPPLSELLNKTLHHPPPLGKTHSVHYTSDSLDLCIKENWFISRTQQRVSFIITKITGCILLFDCIYIISRVARSPGVARSARVL